MHLTLFANHDLNYLNHMKTMLEEGILLVDKIFKSLRTTGFLLHLLI